MSRPSYLTNPIGSPLRRAVRGLALALVALALAATASAQGLERLLPQDTFVAIGLSGLQQHEAKFQPIVDEWVRLDLGALLNEALAEEEVAGELDELDDAIPEAFAGLGFYDFFGDEFWFAVSASRSNPLPTVTVVARVSEEAAAALAQAIEEESDPADFQVLTEGSIEFRVGATDEFDTPIAFAIEGTLVTASSNPDALRGVLRRYQGAAEPSFRDSAGFAAAVAPIMPGNVVAYFDLPTIVGLARPFAEGMGFDASVDRLARALETVGSYGAVTRVTDQGVESLSLQVLGDASLDPSLHALLSNRTPVSSEPLAFVGPGAVGYQAGSTDLGAWWDYLDELSADLPELGIGGLNAFVADNLGLDLNQLLFDWMGDTFATITPAFAPATQIGVMPENLLGDAVYLIETTDPAAAAQGLQMLIQMAGFMASSFADPYGEGGGMPAAPQTRDVGGVSVDSYALAEGVTLEVAITGGYVLIATSSDSMDAALQAQAAGGGLPAGLAELAAEVPLGAGNVSFVDGGASYRALAEQLGAEFGLFAGLAGSYFDFEAVERAGGALQEFLSFVADRMGGAYSYGVSDGGVLRGYSLSRVAW